ncbi:10146_t:CDS:1, partial [Funneliformis mosseae]
NNFAFLTTIFHVTAFAALRRSITYKESSFSSSGKAGLLPLCNF